MSSLHLAQGRRRAAGDELLDRRVDTLLSDVGLDKNSIERLAVGPDARQKLKGILKRLARKEKPFTQCMLDLAKHRPELSDQSRRQICGRLKSMIKGTGRAKAFSDDIVCSPCASLDQDAIKLILAADSEKLDQIIKDLKEAS